MAWQSSPLGTVSTAHLALHHYAALDTPRPPTGFRRPHAARIVSVICGHQKETQPVKQPGRPAIPSPASLHDRRGQRPLLLRVHEDRRRSAPQHRADQGAAARFERQHRQVHAAPVEPRPRDTVRRRRRRFHGRRDDDDLPRRSTARKQAVERGDRLSALAGRRRNVKAESLRRGLGRRNAAGGRPLTPLQHGPPTLDFGPPALEGPPAPVTVPRVEQPRLVTAAAPGRGLDRISRTARRRRRGASRLRAASEAVALTLIHIMHRTLPVLPTQPIREATRELEAGSIRGLI